MDIFFKLFQTDFSCIIYGAIIALVLTALLWFALAKLKSGSTRPVVFKIFLVALFLGLSVTMSVMFGAIKSRNIGEKVLLNLDKTTEVFSLSNMAEVGLMAVEGNILGIMDKVWKTSSEIDVDGITEVKNDIQNNWNLIKLYFDKSEISTSAFILSPRNSIERFCDKMGSIIWVCVIWTLLLIVLVSAIGLILSKLKVS